MLSGQVEKYHQLINALTKISKVPIEYQDIDGGSKGYFSLKDRKIVVQKDMTQVQTLKTLIHEIAHSKLHDYPLDKSEENGMERKDKRTKEVEAESVAYTVCQHFWVDTSDYSFGYIAGWSSGKELDELKSSMMTIRKTASEIISDMNTEIAMSQRPLEQIEDKEELALQVGDKYLSIQKCDEGYDYTFYDANYHGLDGGVIENPDAPITIVAAEIIAAEGLGSVKPVKEVDYDKLQEDAAYTAAYEMEVIAEKKPSIMGQLKDKFGLVEGKRYNRYIKFSGFREYFDICLYKSGDIDIKMRESCHADYLEGIYEYKEDRAQQETFLEKLKDGFAMQIMDVANCKLIDYHSFMDMLHGDWHFKESYDYFNKLVEG